MIDRSIHELESSSNRNFSKGGVAPTRYQLAMHQNRQKRLRRLEAEAIEKRRRRAETQVDTIIELLSRAVSKVASVLNVYKLGRRQELK